MKLTFMLSLLTLLATSCGNPHISSKKDNLEISNPPVTDESETTAGGTAGGTSGGTTTGGTTGGTTTGGTTGGAPCGPGGAGETGPTFFFGSRVEGQADITPERYAAHLNCKTVITETFGSSRNGFSSLITNDARTEYSYELIHQVEKNGHTGATLLEDFFGTQTFSMELERPVSQNGAVGKDRGVDSHSANTETKDTLVWSFSSPVSFWGAKILDVESSPSEPARLRLFDCGRALIKEVVVQYPNNEQGQREQHFIGFIGTTNNVCHLSLTVGDYQRPAPSSSRAFFRALAVDEFNYGK